MTAATAKGDKETSASNNGSGKETIRSKTDGQEMGEDSTSTTNHDRLQAGTNSKTELRQPLKPLKHKKVESATRVHMGKFNPFRDAVIVIGVLGFMAFVGRDFDPSMMKKDPNDRSPILKAFDKMKEDLAKRFEAKRRVEPCDIFLDASAIPGAGLSMFAGRNFTAGDLVLLEAPMLLPLSLADGEAVFLSSYAFLLKHRPNMTNLQGELTTTEKDGNLKRFELRATASILEGDELFVPFDALLHGQSSLFEHIPTEEKYAAVRDIINTIRSSYLKAAAANKGGTKKKVDPSFAVYLVKKSVAIANPIIGTLLPKNNDKYAQMCKTYPLWASWKGNGLPALQVNGKCLSDIKKEASTMVATRDFKKRDVVAPMPMYAMENTMTCTMEEEECRLPSGTSSCFGHQDSRLLLCPLTFSSFITPSSEDPNVEYQWTAKTMRELAIDKVLSSKPGDLSWDLVALRDIETGEEVRTQCCHERNRIGNVLLLHVCSNLFPFSILF
jgi:hypothetical protein